MPESSLAQITPASEPGRGYPAVVTTTAEVDAPPRRRRFRRRSVVLLGAGLVTLALVLALGPLAWVSWSSRGHVYTVDDAPSVPVALVLGAGLNPDGSPSAFLEARLRVAKALYDSGRARVILVSGDNQVSNYDEPTAMRDWLVVNGIPAAAVVRDFAGRDTYDSCVRANRIFGVDHALIVSQGFHLPRAVAICRAVGIDADGVGDWTARTYADIWAAGERREKLAATKAVLDVVSDRDPVLGPVDTSVRDALAASNTNG
jgi:vancomycin permeability regulator SanA